MVIQFSQSNAVGFRSELSRLDLKEPIGGIERAFEKRFKFARWADPEKNGTDSSRRICPWSMQRSASLQDDVSIRFDCSEAGLVYSSAGGR